MNGAVAVCLYEIPNLLITQLTFLGPEMTCITNKRCPREALQIEGISDKSAAAGRWRDSEGPLKGIKEENQIGQTMSPEWIGEKEAVELIWSVS